MKEYPSISRTVIDCCPVYAFDKIDGSNIRAEWSRKNKRGFYKFGKRHGLVDESDTLLGEAKGIVLENYSETLAKIFVDNRWQNVVCFFEYFGENSFAGNHLLNESHEVVLIDVTVDKKGILLPKEFNKTFSSKVKIAPLLYHGNPNEEFIKSVQKGSLEGMTFEGVVCKAQKFISPGRPLMFKIKNLAWIEKVKRKYQKTNPEMIERLL